MTKRNTVIFIIGTLLTALLVFNCSAGFMDFLSVQFIVSAVICGICATMNIYFGLACGIINLIFSYAGGGTKGLILYFFIVLFGLIAGILVKNKCASGKLILINSAGFLFSCIFGAVFISFVTGTNVIESYITRIKPEFIEVMNQYFGTLGLNDYNAVAAEFVEAYFIYVQNMIPSIFIVIALTFSFVSAIIVSVILKLSGKHGLFKVEFSRFMCDRTTAIVFLISGACSIFLKSGVLQTVFMNIFVILLFVFQVCGFSLIDSILKKKSMPLGVRALILLVCAMFATGGILLIILIIAAILDSFKNFRGIGIETNGSDKGSE